MADELHGAGDPSLIGSVRSTSALLPFPMLVIDREGTIVMASAAAEKEFGHGSGHMVGHDVYGLIREPDQAAVRAALERCWNDVDPSPVVRGPVVEIGGEDGRAWPVEVTLSRFAADGSSLVLCTFYGRDVPDPSPTSLAGRDASDARMAEALRTRNKFVSMAGHELRSPLTPILGYSEAILVGIYGELTDKQRGVIENISASGNRLKQLIDDIVDYVRADLAPGDFEMSAVDAASLLASCKAESQGTASAKSVVIEVEIGEDLPHVFASEPHLKKLVLALLDNAVKFTPNGGSLGLRAHRVEGTDAVEFEVWDSGAGIQEEVRDQIFQPFVKFRHNTADGVESSGLGLAKAAKLAELHGGTLRLRSSDGHGSTFTFSCPTAPE